MTPPTAGLVERVRLIRVSASFGFAEVRLAAVNLAGLRVELNGRGDLRLVPPTIQANQGQPRPAYALQPGAAEEIQAAIAELWHGPRA